LPHRTNAELARLFDVRLLPPTAEDKRLGAVRLRFGLPGYDPAKTYIEAAFSKRHGLPVAWESHFDGRLAQRIRFQGLAASNPPRWQRVQLEDPSGHVVLQWELLAEKERGEEVPDILAGWNGYVQFDNHADRPQADSAFSESLAAIRRGAWSAAADELRHLLESHPQHPLLLVLLAACREHDERIARREQFLTWLRDAAESPATDVTRFIRKGSFPSLRLA
jgi:hypothetical protein